MFSWCFWYNKHHEKDAEYQPSKPRYCRASSDGKNADVCEKGMGTRTPILD